MLFSQLDFTSFSRLPWLLSGKESACQCRKTQERQVCCLDQEDSLEKEMATYSSVLAWKILWTEEPGGLQSMGLQKAGYDLATKQQQIPLVRGSHLSQTEGFTFKSC